MRIPRAFLARIQCAIAPANTQSNVPNDEGVQKAVRAEKAYEEVGGKCRKSQKSEGLEPGTSVPEPIELQTQ